MKVAESAGPLGKPTEAMNQPQTPQPVEPSAEQDGWLARAMPKPASRLSIAELMAAVETMQCQGRVDLALQLYSDWRQHSSAGLRHLVTFNHGALLQSMGRWADARQAYESCLQDDPDFPQALINLGLLEESQGHAQRALNLWSRAAAARWLNAQFSVEMVTTALNHIGRLHENHKDYDLAERALEESLRLDPAQPSVIQHWVHIRQKACAWPARASVNGVSPHRLLASISPLAMLALEDDPAQQLLVAQSFVQRTYPLPQEQLHRQHPRTPHPLGKIRLGYVSGDLCVHAVGLLMADVFEAHDRSRFELHAYDFSPEDGSAHRDRLKAALDHFHDIRACSDQEAAAQIANDGIDILIDLHGLSSGARPGIFARRPAPLQGTWLGFIGSTALPWLDFTVADTQALHPAALPFMTEAPLMVEGSMIPIPHRSGPLVPVPRATQNLPEDAFLMAAMGNVYKLNQDQFDVWMELLRRIPSSVLWLIDDNRVTSANLRRHLKAAGVDESRLVLTPRVPHGGFAAHLAAADVFLDTYPYNCGSTTTDVLTAGVPMVSLAGRSMVSRMGASLLQATGHGHFVTTDTATYMQRVEDLAELHAQGTPLRWPTPDALSLTRRMVQSLERALLTRLRAC